MRYFPVVLLLALICFRAPAQEFGGSPFSVRWSQINTDTARIVFPEGMDSTAEEIASLIGRLAAANPFSLGKKPGKINVVLRNQTVISNGYVGMGPFRSEFYMNPPSNNFDQGTTDWATQLTIHEYRHVHQYNNFNNGASKWIRAIFGQQGYGVAVSAAIPNWFYEGDAVYQETRLSEQGRGRMPSFLKAYPALWSLNRKYNWMKLRNGSLKDYVPNHYDLGYLLVSYGYEKFGDAFWQNVTRDASAFKGVFYPFQRAVKKYSGENFTQFTQNAMGYYRGLYRFNEKTPGTEQERIKGSEKVINEVYPQIVSPDSLLFMKSTYSERPGFYIRDKKGEHLVRFRDISLDRQFSYRNGQIVYAAYEKDPRWQGVDYSVIRVLDLATDVQRSLRPRTRYFTPDISGDGTRIVVNEVLANGRSALVILDAGSGNVVGQVRNDSIDYFAGPRFLDNQQIVAAIRTKSGRSFIGLVNTVSGTITSLTTPSFSLVGDISVDSGKVYFTGSEDLKDNIFSLDISTGNLHRLRTQDLTNYYARFGFGQLSWSSFTADGFRVRQAAAAALTWEPVSQQEFARRRMGKEIDKHLNEFNVTESLPGREFTVQKYAALSHPFNFHSWRPDYEDPEFSFSVFGNNVLNTTDTRLYYLYNQNDRTHAAGGDLLYGGLFPYIHLGSKYTFNRSRQIQRLRKEWDQWENDIGLQIPLSWTGGRTIRSLNLGTDYSYRIDFNKGLSKVHFNTVRFSYLDHFIRWSHQVQMTRQDIFPKWGFQAYFRYAHSISYYDARQVFSRMNLFLPGLAPAHALVLSASLQDNSGRDRPFSDQFPWARGFDSPDSAKVWGIRLNYHLPLFYPDFGFANVFYLQRVRGAVFYDYNQARGQRARPTQNLKSTGAEIYLDTKWWNEYPLTFGLRGGYLLSADPLSPNRKIFFEFVLPVSLIPR